MIKNNNNIQLNQNKKQNINDNNNNNKIIDNATNTEMQVNQHTNNDLDFSQLLTLVVNGKQNLTNTNSNYNTNNANNTNNVNNTNNINNTNNNLNNNQQNGGKENVQNFVSNFFNNKQKTYNDNDNDNDNDGNTMIIHESEKLLPATLKNIFNENRAEKIIEEMKISKQKETKKKIFNFGKQAAKLFKNHKVILIEKNKDESIELRNKNIMSSKSITKEDMDHSTSNFINLNQNKAFLEKIPEFNSDEEYSIHHFSNSDLIHEEVVSFTFESIYQNINAYTNLEYSKNKKYQQKTLFYLTKLMSNKSKILSSFSEDDLSSEMNKSNSFSKSSKNTIISNDRRNMNSAYKNTLINSGQFDIFNSPINSKVYNNFCNSEVLYKTKKHRNKNGQKKTNNKLSRIYTELNSNNIGFSSMKPKRSSNFHSKSPKRKRYKKNEVKFTFKIDTNNGDNNLEINSNTKSKKKIRKIISLAPERIKNNRKKNDDSSLQSEDMSSKKIKNSKTTKTKKYSRKVSQSDNRLNIKENFLKRKSGQPNRDNGKLKLENVDELPDNKGGLRNSLAYFAKEEKEDCIII